MTDRNDRHLDPTVTDREIDRWWSRGAPGGADIRDVMFARGERPGGGAATPDQVAAARTRIALAIRSDDIDQHTAEIDARLVRIHFWFFICTFVLCAMIILLINAGVL